MLDGQDPNSTDEDDQGPELTVWQVNQELYNSYLSTPIAVRQASFFIL
jgi:hypothetical protein